MRTSAQDTRFPLAPLQEAMLFNYLKEPHSGVDVEQIVLHLRELIDLGVLERSWRELVARHDVLRTEFDWLGGDRPQQRILPGADFEWVVHEAGDVAEPERRQRLDRFLKVDRRRGFDLSRGPLLRITCFRWAADSLSVVWTFHHALLDGRSYAPLLREAFEIQAALCAGSAPTEVDGSRGGEYRRHVEWLKSQDFSRSDPFWREQLAGFRAPTPLVVERSAPLPEGETPSAERWDGITSEATRHLRTWAAMHGLTLNTLLMTAWAVLLHRYSGEEDIVFGTTRACRRSAEAGAEAAAGLYINTVPMRVRLQATDTLQQVAEAIRRLWVASRDHEHSPLARIRAVSEVSPQSPLFETLVVFERVRLDDALRALGGAWSKRDIELHELTNFPITLAAYDGDALTFKIEYDRRRFEDEAIVRMLGHLRTLLEGAAEQPLAQVGKLPLITAQERAELIAPKSLAAKSLQPAAPQRLPLNGGVSLGALFGHEAAAHPDSIALRDGAVSLSYRELDERSNRVAHLLRQGGAGPEVLVGMYLPRTLDLVTTILGILKSGAAYLPIDLAYPPQRVAYMLEDSQAPLALTDRAHEAILRQALPPGAGARILCIEDIVDNAVSAAALAPDWPEADPDSLAYVIYTSGTTGKPKGSMITHRNVVRLFAATESWYGFGADDTWTLFHSCAFDFSVWEIWGALLYGGRLVVVPYETSRSPEGFYDLLATERVTVLNQTPSAFRQLIHAEEQIGQRALALRYVIFGGEALEMQSLAPWFERHGDRMPLLVNMYGITETTVHVTWRPLAADDVRRSSVIGEPIPDLGLYILDPGGEPVPIGVPGEIHVSGAGLSRGYLHREDLTSARFIADRLTGAQGARLYRSGDLARRLPGGDIEYLGRIDDQVKVRGFRIELGEIEAALLRCAGIRECCAMARDDGQGKRIVAYLVSDAARADVGRLREQLLGSLPDYMVPAAFVFLGGLPLTPHGKVDRKALPAPAQERPILALQFKAPQSGVQIRLAAIWQKVLRIECVGIEDNFFELGGDSILCIQVVAQARREGLALTPQDLLSRPTIAELAELLKTKNQATGTASAAPAPAPVATAVSVAPDAPATGAVVSTPILHWFFEQRLAQIGHYNQAVLLRTATSLDAQRLDRALGIVDERHDALRLRATRAASGWTLHQAAPGAYRGFETLDLSTLDDAGCARRIEQAAQVAQASLEIGAGPLWRAVNFDLGPQRGGRLLIVVHHLAVDGVSWRPLIEDLESAYVQLARSASVDLPARTTAFQAWASRLADFARSDAPLRAESTHWQAVVARVAEMQANPADLERRSSDDTEGTARTVRVALDTAATARLLHDVPAAYGTQINDVLLCALLLAWQKENGRSALCLNLEGHGREELFEADLTRTVGWFTSLFPLVLELPTGPAGNSPGAALMAVKEQLRAIPRRGIGYGLLRYLVPDSGLARAAEPSVLFNYLGQADRLLAGGTLFSFAPESSGSWHGPMQQRRHALECNAEVKEGALAFAWTCAAGLEPQARALANRCIEHLQLLVAHCTGRQSAGHTPSDFPLAKLSQPALGQLLAQRPDVLDIHPLAPIQALFHSSNPGPLITGFDQWQATLAGELDVEAFKGAWAAAVARHSLLRSAIVADAAADPLVVVQRGVDLPWQVEDWRALPEAGAARWDAFLAADRAHPLDLRRAPVMRFALVRIGDTRWKFLWSLPALMLDGWSWPLVFRDVGASYDALRGGRAAALPEAPAYRDYVAWINGTSHQDARQFWREALQGFTEPTLLPGGSGPVPGEGSESQSWEIDAAHFDQIVRLARALQMSTGTLLQAAWALVLRRHATTDDVVFGAAVSARPVELPGSDEIVGPCVNNVPVRLSVDSEGTVRALLRQAHERATRSTAAQVLPLMEIQRESPVPWRSRLFDSLLVFQNYAVGQAAHDLGGTVRIEEFHGPIHSSYPLLVLIDPPSRAGAALRVTLISDSRVYGAAAAATAGADFARVLRELPRLVDATAASLLESLSKPVPATATQAAARRTTLRRGSQNIVRAQGRVEAAIAEVWRELLGVDEISVEDNFFDVGGHSTLLVQIHARLRDVLKGDLKGPFPIVTLFQHPTIRSLARSLEPVGSHAVGARVAEQARRGVDQVRDRAERQRAAFAAMRSHTPTRPRHGGA
jgi:amino acid adenylation domain-containing protein/non-ribosomal peptide synthase protein (TIGR01720 family)